MLSLIKSQRGSATVEAAILVPIVILSIAAVIYISLILCERCSMQAAADNASEAGSAIWRHSAANIQSGKVYSDELEADSLYWRILDAKKGLKKDKAESLAYSYKYSQYAAKPESKEVFSSMTDYIIYKKLSIGLEQNYKVPISGFLSIFGVDNNIKMHVCSLSVIQEPSELIRNIDFASDLEKELEKKYPSVKNIGVKARDSINEVKEKLNKFFN